MSTANHLPNVEVSIIASEGAGRDRGDGGSGARKTGGSQVGGLDPGAWGWTSRGARAGSGNWVWGRPEDQVTLLWFGSLSLPLGSQHCGIRDMNSPVSSLQRDQTPG